MDLQIAGKTALVTGASAGIGRGIALAFAAEGVKLAVFARRTNLLEDLAREIRASGGTPPEIIAGDFVAEGAAERLASEALRRLGSVEILVNCAGGSRSLPIDAPEERWTEGVTLNFTRQRQLTHALLPQMIERRWGRIISVTGKSEPRGLNAANAAKAAMHAWSKGLSREIGKYAITTNCLAPGKIVSEQILRNYSPELRAREAAEDIPLGEYGQPADLANLACFLASPLARYITGTVIPVDGGLRRYQF